MVCMEATATLTQQHRGSAFTIPKGTVVQVIEVDNGEAACLAWTDESNPVRFDIELRHLAWCD